MKYESSLTKPIITVIVVLLLFWVVNLTVIIGSNGIKDASVFSVLMLVFSIVFVSAFVKGIYITLENNNVKYVHMFVIKKTVEIGKIKKVQKGLMSGFYPSLSLVYEENGNIQDIKISTITFKKDILKQFVSDLKKQNPQIDIDESVQTMGT